MYSQHAVLQIQLLYFIVLMVIGLFDCDRMMGRNVTSETWYFVIWILACCWIENHLVSHLNSRR